MVPAAPWPWVSSQTSRPDVAQAGVATWPVRAAAPGAAMAAAGTRAAVQANAPAMKNRRAAVVRKFMMYSFVQEGQPGDSRDYVSCSLEQSPDTSARYTALSRSVGCRGTAARARTGAAWQGVAPRSAGPNGPGYAACGGVLTTGQPAHQPGESDREWVESALPAVVVLAGVGLAGVLLIASSLKYPGIYRLPGAGAVVALSVAALLGVRRMRDVGAVASRRRAAHRTSLGRARRRDVVGGDLGRRPGQVQLSSRASNRLHVCLAGA